MVDFASGFPLIWFPVSWCCRADIMSRVQCTFQQRVIKSSTARYITAAELPNSVLPEREGEQRELKGTAVCSDSPWEEKRLRKEGEGRKGGGIDLLRRRMGGMVKDRRMEKASEERWQTDSDLDHNNSAFLNEEFVQNLFIHIYMHAYIYI